MAAKYQKYLCTIAVAISSLAFIIGGIYWYIDMAGEPLTFLYVLPGIIILFGIGIAYTCFKVLTCQYPSSKKNSTHYPKS